MRRTTWRTIGTAAVLLAGAACTPPPSGPPKDCSLRGPYVDLSYCDLSGETFSMVDMTGANLSHADLTDAQFIGVRDMSGPTPVIWPRFIDADFAHADLTGADFVGPGDYSGASFFEATLAGADFDGLPIEGWATFYNNDFRGAVLDGARGDEYAFAGADFTGASIRDFVGVEGGFDGIFVGADLTRFRSWLVGALTGDFRGATLVDMWFSSGTISGDFTGADLSGSDLDFTNLAVIDLTDARFRNANIAADSAFTTANLTRTDFTGSTIDPYVTTSSVTWLDTICPNGITQSTPCF